MVNRSGEAAIVGVAGAVLAGAAGSIVGLAAPAAVVGALNGVISGHRRIYSWRKTAGVVAFVLDSTWGLATTAAAVVSHGVGAVRGAPGFTPPLSERQNRHVYARGMTIRRGFAITYGNSVNGTGDTTHPRRAKLVTDHEDVHVWQARWLGPLYPVIYAGWMVGGAVGWRLRVADASWSSREWWSFAWQNHRVVCVLPQPTRVVGVQP